jgi:2,3-bisphosphoglycerate-independent phosphoglycerate mutase
VSSFTLRRHPKFPGRPGPVVLAILDGVGLGARDESDAVFLARTPTLDRLWAGPLHCALVAHGRAVGMPSDGDMGNSEVGHNALGCGRVYDQGAKLVARAIADGTLFEGEVWKALVGRAAAPKAARCTSSACCPTATSTRTSTT